MTRTPEPPLSRAQESHGACIREAWRIMRALERDLSEGARDALASDLACLALAVGRLQVADS